MHIVLGSDHRGFELKHSLCAFLRQQGYDVQELGCFSAEDRVDYPEIAAQVARSVLSGAAQRGVVICGSGLGVSMAANRHAGIRAALCVNEYMARVSRLHNDANVLALGADVVGEALAQSIVETFLAVEFESGRHLRRVEMLDTIVEDYKKT